MKRKTIGIFVISTLLFLICICIIVATPLIWSHIRPQPREKNEILFQGVKYIRDVRQSPRQMVVHIVIIDLKTPGLSFLVTPGEGDEELPLKARTTSEFLSDFDLQLAINGDGFTPWYSNSIFDYYPHSGDPVAPIGFAASRGEIYSQVTDDEPVLYISRANRVQFNRPPGKIYNAISGNQMLVEKGKPLPSPDKELQPRTAIGIDRQERRLIIVVIDGRQPGYSAGASRREVADILIEFGAFSAMNLDGGGSSTLVKQGLFQPVVLNSPIDHGIPKRQRVVGNHFGVYAPPIDQ